MYDAFAPAPAEFFDACLVVEDDSIIRLDVEETLRGFGFRRVLGAATLEAAAEIAVTSGLRFAVLDFEVGRGNTIGVASLLTARGIAAVFLTAHGSSIELPPDLRHLQVISKPFSSGMLADALRLSLAKMAAPCDKAISCLSAAG